MMGAQFGLARLAAEAEMLRLRHLARRTATRVAFALVAIVFLFAALIFAHAAIFAALLPRLSPIHALLAVGAGDIVIALVLGLLAARSHPSRVERDALKLRNDARQRLLGNGMWMRLLMTFWALRRR